MIGNNSYGIGLKAKRVRFLKFVKNKHFIDTKYVMSMFVQSLKYTDQEFTFPWNCPEYYKFVMKKWGKCLL